MSMTLSMFCKPIDKAYQALLRANNMGVTDISYYPNAGFEAGFVFEGDPQTLKMPKGYALRKHEFDNTLYLYRVRLGGIIAKPLFFIHDCRGWDWEHANDPGM